MANWWHGLNPRERALIGFGLPALLGLMFYFYAWQPTWTQRATLRESVPESQAILAWMQHRIDNAKAVSGQNSSESTDQPLLTVIERVAISAKVADAIQRVQPSNTDTVEIWFQEAVADALFRWIDQLAKMGIAVESATITRATPGRVTARVKLSRL